MCVRALFACASESDSFYRSALCWPGRRDLFLTSMIFGFSESVKAAGL